MSSWLDTIEWGSIAIIYIGLQVIGQILVHSILVSMIVWTKP